MILGVFLFSQVAFSQPVQQWVTIPANGVFYFAEDQCPSECVPVVKDDGTILEADTLEWSEVDGKRVVVENQAKKQAKRDAERAEQEAKEQKRKDRKDAKDRTEKINWSQVTTVNQLKAIVKDLVDKDKE